MKILGIESSCDDTSVAMIEVKYNKTKILAEKTASQIDIHKKYGGVVPEIAGRKHAEKMVPLIENVITKCGKPDVIAVTAGPGLMTGLLVGTEAARTLSYLMKIPLVAVNHIAGHIHSVKLTSPELKLNKHKFPILNLVVSGGHTALILMHDVNKYKLIGTTRDDAAGECFDKVGKMVGIDYPGGPKISTLAKTGKPQAISFPRPMLTENNFDFSFSGLKTSALYWLKDNAKKKIPNNSKASFKLNKNITLGDFCASLEAAIVEILVSKTKKAADKHQPKAITITGGVSANQLLRDGVSSIYEHTTTPVYFPDKKHCMDNAAMIAQAGYFLAKNKQFTSWKKLTADPNWKIY